MKAREKPKKTLRCFILNEFEYNLIIDLLKTCLDEAQVVGCEIDRSNFEYMYEELVTQCEMQGGF